MAVIEYLFVASIVGGIITTLFALYARKYALEENRDAVHLRTVAIFLFCLGFIVHTSGDFFGSLYSSENLELLLEDIAHVLLFISFTVFIISAKHIIRFSREHSFN